MIKNGLKISARNTTILVLGITIIISIYLFCSMLYLDFRKDKIFQQNQLCVQHMSAVRNGLENDNNMFSDNLFVDIFYSPKENDCFYAYEVFLSPSNPNYKSVFENQTNESVDNRTISVIKRVGSGPDEDYARFHKNRYNELTKTYFYATISELKN